MIKGWSNGERLFALALVVAIALALLYSNCAYLHRQTVSPPSTHCLYTKACSAKGVTQQLPNGEPGPESASAFITNRDLPQWLAGIAGFAAALFTIWLIHVTQASVGAANAAATAARETAETMINIERGRLIFESASRDDWMLHYLFLTQGKQALTILGIGHHFQFAEDERSAVAVRDIAVTAMEVNAHPGQHVGEWAGEANQLVGMPFIPIPREIWEPMTKDATLRLVATLRLIYRTSFGIYVQSHTIMFTDGNMNLTLWRRDLTHDWPMERWNERMSMEMQEHAKERGAAANAQRP